MSSFEEAVKAKQEGKKAYCLSQVGCYENHWTRKLEKSIAYLEVFNDNIYRFQREDHQYKLMTEDFDATDWVIVDEM